MESGKRVGGRSCRRRGRMADAHWRAAECTIYGERWYKQYDATIEDNWILGVVWGDQRLLVGLGLRPQQRRGTLEYPQCLPQRQGFCGAFPKVIRPLQVSPLSGSSAILASGVNLERNTAPLALSCYCHALLAESLGLSNRCGIAGDVKVCEAIQIH